MRTSIALVLAVVFALAACDHRGDATEPGVPVVAGLPDTVTFADVAPIVRAHCMPCHREGQAGPFHLISYRDVRKKAKTIRKMVVHRWMPPWPADTAYSSFLGVKALNAREIATIVKWEIGRASCRERL